MSRSTGDTFAKASQRTDTGLGLKNRQLWVVTVEEREHPRRGTWPKHWHGVRKRTEDTGDSYKMPFLGSVSPHPSHNSPSKCSSETILGPPCLGHHILPRLLVALHQVNRRAGPRAPHSGRTIQCSCGSAIPKLPLHLPSSRRPRPGPQPRRPRAAELRARACPSSRGPRHPGQGEKGTSQLQTQEARSGRAGWSFSLTPAKLLAGKTLPQP